MTPAEIARLNDNSLTAAQIRERDACIEAQARYHDTFVAIGDSHAPPPMHSETSLEFERRLMRRLQPMSARFKDTDFGRIGHQPTLTALGDAVRADAMAHVRDPKNFVKGKIKWETRNDASGRPITKAAPGSDPNGCWDQFNPPIKFAQNGLASFRTPSNR